jgi:hypothetical protein
MYSRTAQLSSLNQIVPHRHCRLVLNASGSPVTLAEAAARASASHWALSGTAAPPEYVRSMERHPEPTVPAPGGGPRTFSMLRPPTA